MSWTIKAEEGPVQSWFDNLVRTVEAQRSAIVTDLSTMIADITEQSSELLRTAETPEKRETMLQYISANLNGVLNKSFSGAAFTDEMERVLVTEDVIAHLKAEADYLNQEAGEPKEKKK
jgi:hypothetical protein